MVGGALLDKMTSWEGLTAKTILQGMEIVISYPGQGDGGELSADDDCQRL